VLTLLLPLHHSCRFAKSGNKDFATAVALWTLGDRGVLKVRAARWLAGDAATEQPGPHMYFTQAACMFTATQLHADYNFY
jgi:hypothetical protein